jgi:hypothetical protein
MAFLGDFGRYFLGGSTTADVGGATGTYLGGLVGKPLVGGAIGKGVGSFLGNIGTADQAQEQSALPTPPPGRPADLGAQEDRSSGTTFIDQRNFGGMQSQAGLGNLLPLLTSGIGRFLSSKGGQVATSVATGVGAAGLFGGADTRQRPVLTQSRRNKARVRQLVNFMGIEGAADFLSQSSGQNVSPNDVVMLLLRTFRNDGAYITKAQVRNLRRTTNRFKSLEKQVKEATSMSRTTRRAPVRRSASSTTLIRN